MATVERALQTQIRNIEAQYGRSMGHWTELIRAGGLTRHGQIVAMLKQDHGLSHGSANRVALVALAALNGEGSSSPAASLGVVPAPRPAAVPLWMRIPPTSSTPIVPRSDRSTIA